MLDYAVKLTVAPASVTEDDIGNLRREGFGDRDILDICEVTSYYAYVNRMADGLGVTLETWGTGG
jgi:alkylhydroperoxidase family enzyme